MKFKLTLRQKSFFALAGAFVGIYAIAFLIISTKARSTAMNDAVSLTASIAQNNALEIKLRLEKDLVALNTAARSIVAQETQSHRKEVSHVLYQEILNANPRFISLWDSRELKYINPNFTKDFGRSTTFCQRVDGKIACAVTEDTSIDNAEYANLKQNRSETIGNPLINKSLDYKDPKYLTTQIAVPIIHNGTFIGAMGATISLDEIQALVSQLKPLKGSYAFLVANNLKYVAHPQLEKHDEYLLDDYQQLVDKHGIAAKIANGQSAAFLGEDLNGQKAHFTFTPIFIGQTHTPWTLAIVVPKKTIFANANKNITIAAIIGILFTLAISIFFLLASKKIAGSVESIAKTLQRLAVGDLSNTEMSSKIGDNELGTIAKALSSTLEGLHQKVDFAQCIEKGMFQSELKALSENDALAHALIGMQNSLVKAAEEETIRREEENKRRWANEGLAKFSEILRQNNDNMEVLARSIVKELVETLNANQGGVFLLNDDNKSDSFFDLVAAFAYNKHKYTKKQVLLGEGLIGACAAEKKTVHLTEIPQDYIAITSGLGQSTPTSLIIVPLLIEEEVLGVIEIASFETFEPHHIEFTEKIAESIASTIASVKVNIRTTELLTRTQQQAEEMAAQDEEMRQNMEELQATQEESNRKTAEMESIVEAINNACFVTEYDAQGYIISINDSYLKLLNLDRDEVLGSHHTGHSTLSGEMKDEYDRMWNNLHNGIPQKQVNIFSVKDKTFTFQESYTPIKNEMGDIYKILKISFSINE